MKASEYYLQDRRTLVGNSLLWWAKGCQGYTTDISKAEVFTFAEAEAQMRKRSTDFAWPKEYVDSKVVSVVEAHSLDGYELDDDGCDK